MMDAKSIQVVFETEDGEKRSFVTDLIPAREYERVQAENDRLREQVANLIDCGFQMADKVCCFNDENDKLRELVRDMWTCIQTADKSDNAWDECDRCILWNGNNSHRCRFDVRMRELGVEV